MEEQSTQRRLSSAQVEEFYHDNFVGTQVDHFRTICEEIARKSGGFVVDVGGGCGFFAAALVAETGLPVRVIESTLPRSSIAGPAASKHIWATLCARRRSMTWESCPST